MNHKQEITRSSLLERQADGVAKVHGKHPQNILETTSHDLSLSYDENSG
jgi:hypothetical protein